MGMLLMPHREALPLDYYPKSSEWEPSEQALGAFLWSCPERAETGREGLFAMTPGDVFRGVARAWKVEEIEQALAGLVRHRWLVRDAGWMFIVPALRNCPPIKGQRTVKAAVNRVRQAPRDSAVWAAYVDEAEIYAADLFRELMRDPRNARPNLGQTVGANGCPKLPQSLPQVAPTVAPSCPNAVAPTQPGESPVATGDIGVSNEALSSGLARVRKRHTAFHAVEGEDSQAVGEGTALSSTARPSGSDQSSGAHGETTSVPGSGLSRTSSGPSTSTSAHAGADMKGRDS